MHTHPELLLRHAHDHTAHLRSEAARHRLATATRTSTELRVRVGWTLVEVGLRLASTPRRVATAQPVP
jgi:hypothetical protein